MDWRKSFAAKLITCIAACQLVVQGCPDVGNLQDCVDEDSISQAEYEDLSDFEQSLYEENSCGRYEPRWGFLDGVL